MDSHCVLIATSCGGCLPASVHFGFPWSAIAQASMGWVRSCVTRFLNTRRCSVGTAKRRSYFSVPKKVVYLQLHDSLVCVRTLGSTAFSLSLHFFKRCLPLPSPPLHSELVHSHADPPSSIFPFEYFAAKSTWAQSCSERSHILREMLSSWLWCFYWGVLPPLGIPLQSPHSVVFTGLCATAGSAAGSTGSVRSFPPWRVSWHL